MLVFRFRSELVRLRLVLLGRRLLEQLWVELPRSRRRRFRRPFPRFRLFFLLPRRLPRRLIRPSRSDRPPPAAPVRQAAGGAIRSSERAPLEGSHLTHSTSSLMTDTARVTTRGTGTGAQGVGEAYWGQGWARGARGLGRATLACAARRSATTGSGRVRRPSLRPAHACRSSKGKFKIRFPHHWARRCTFLLLYWMCDHNEAVPLSLTLRFLDKWPTQLHGESLFPARLRRVPPFEEFLLL